MTGGDDCMNVETNIGVRMCMVMVLPPDAPDPVGMVRSRYESRPRKLSVDLGEIRRVQHLGGRP